MWVILRHENEYDQHGGYFVAVYHTLEECVSPNGHFGRKGTENVWYTVKRIVVGFHYDEESHVHHSYDNQ